MMGQYDDIINMEHPTSKKHPRMPIGDRAAQFAPFAALTGYDAAIKEAARLTDEMVELDESSKAELDSKLRELCDRLPDNPEAKLVYFEPDGRKTGGAYIAKIGSLKKIDPFERRIILTDGTAIDIDTVVGIEIIKR